MQKEERDCQHKLVISPLRQQSDFNLVNKLGRKYKSSHFICVTHKPQIVDVVDLKFNEVFLGLKVSKKIGNAVVRNKVRRRLKHIIRHSVLNSQSDHRNRRFVIVPHSNIVDSSYESIIDEMAQIFTQMK